MQHRLWTPDVFSHSDWFHHRVRLSGFCHNFITKHSHFLSELMYLESGEQHYCWHLITEADRREDVETNILPLSDSFLSVSHQHVLFFSLLSCHTWLMLAGSQRQSVDALNNIFWGGQEVRSQSRQRPDQLYRWSHDKINIWQERWCRTTLNQTSGFNITNIFLTSGICPFTVNLLYTRKHT